MNDLPQEGIEIQAVTISEKEYEMRLVSLANALLSLLEKEETSSDSGNEIRGKSA